MDEVARNTLAKHRAKVLWCVHVLGPDEVIAMPSYSAAEEHAQKLIEALYTAKTAELDVLCLPIVAVWPHSKKGHADELARSDSSSDSQVKP